MPGLLGMTFNVRRGRLLKTGQLTAYRAADDGDYEKGLAKAYTVLTLGQYSLTSNLDVPHYAAPTISFTAADTLADSANGLVTFLTGDTIVVKGSPANNGVYTVSNGATADHFHVAPNVVNEGAGAYVSLYKQASHPNACVLDRRTGLMWSRYSSYGQKLGPTSNGRFAWYDVALCFILHPLDAFLQIIAATNTLRIVGGAVAEATRYHVGDPLVCVGFANPVNNLAGYRVLSVTVNGADLDIVLKTFNNTLISEAAGGNRSIALICRGMFGYSAAANTIGLAGYTDWRMPDVYELHSLCDFEAPNALPDGVAFPSWNASNFWTSTTRPTNTADALFVSFSNGDVSVGPKTAADKCCALVRGG